MAQNICNGSEAVVVADEYLNPGRMPSQHTLNTPVDTPLAPSTPTQKFTFQLPAVGGGGPPAYQMGGGGNKLEDNDPQESLHKMVLHVDKVPHFDTYLVPLSIIVLRTMNRQ